MPRCKTTIENEDVDKAFSHLRRLNQIGWTPRKSLSEAAYKIQMTGLPCEDGTCFVFNSNFPNQETFSTQILAGIAQFANSTCGWRGRQGNTFKKKMIGYYDESTRPNDLILPFKTLMKLEMTCYLSGVGAVGSRLGTQVSKLSRLSQKTRLKHGEEGPTESTKVFVNFMSPLHLNSIQEFSRWWLNQPS